MGCCGRALTSRPPISGASDAPSAAALSLLREHVSVDVHSHGGPMGITSRGAPAGELPRGMRAGGIAIVCLADAPDGPLPGRDANSVLAAVRPAKPGELYRYHLDRLKWVDDLVAAHGLRRALT